MGPNRTLFRKKQQQTQPVVPSKSSKGNNNKNKKEPDTSKRTLFLSTRATAQETKTALQQFTQHRKAKPSNSPQSPRDVMGERALIVADLANARKAKLSEEASKGLETASTASTTAWSILEAPTLQTKEEDDDDKEESPLVDNNNTTSPRILCSLHPTCTSDNVSLADSSITTEVGFPGTHATTTTTTPLSSLQAPSTPQRGSSPLSNHHPCPNSTFSSTTTNTWHPRSLRDLVRKDLHSHDMTVVERALHQITLDCWDDLQARSMVARAGGLLTILNLLEDYASEERVAVASCQALEKLSLDADNELAVSEMGGCNILWNLATTSVSGRVQEAAWAALQNCTCQCHSASPPLDMEIWATEVLARLQDYPAQLVHAAAAAANVCVADARQCEEFGKAGGLVAMATALQRHWSNTSVRTDLAQSMTRIFEALGEEKVKGKEG